MHDLRSEEVEGVTLLDVALGTVAQREGGDFHVADIVAFRHTHGDGACRLVDDAIVGVGLQSRDVTVAVEQQVRGVGVGASRQSQHHDERVYDREKLCLHGYHCPMFCV